LALKVKDSGGFLLSCYRMLSACAISLSEKLRWFVEQSLGTDRFDPVAGDGHRYPLGDGWRFYLETSLVPVGSKNSAELEFAKMIGADREQVQTNHSWAVAS